MGHPGQQAHPEVLAVMEEGVKVIRESGIAAGVSCPDSLIPRFLDLGVQYFHSNVASLLQSAGQAYLKTMRQAAESKRQGDVS
jgi:2-keto-3-deoxy-L-rhamnonate aldolase RhmA